MRVLQYSGAFAGAQKQIELAIHRQLKQAGHESRILCTIGEPEKPDIICCENKIENIVRRALWKATRKNYRSAAWSTHKLIREIKRFRPDLVHLHTIHHGYVDYPMLLRYFGKKKIPVLYTLHDMWPFTGGCYYYTKTACNGFRDGCRHCAETEAMDCICKQAHHMFTRKKKLLEGIENLRFVAVSDWVYEEAKKSAIRKYPLDTVWNAIELSADFELTEHKKQYNNFRIIGVASSWTERKGIRRFFELARRLGDGFEIILVGSVDLQQKKDAPANVVFAGRISDRGELYRLYADADVHISMSTEETFGMTFVEAAFTGVRSIGFDSTAIPSVLNRVQGIIVPAGDMDVMEQTVRNMENSRGKGHLSREAMVEIKQFFSAERMAQQYENIYMEMVK